MLKETIVAVLFFAFLSVGCDPEERDEINVEIDSTAPFLSVSGMETIIEKATTVNVTITDSSEISTTIAVNGNEVYNSTQKGFSFDFDPFDYPSGPNTATITVTDDEDNSAEQTFQFEIKKLLYRQNSGFSSDTVDAYVAINLRESGKLIAFRQMHTSEDANFYATEEFSKQDLIITQYTLSKNADFHLGRSYAPVAPGTERLTYNEVLNTLGLEHRFANKDNQFAIAVDETPAFLRYNLLGYDYSFGNSVNPNLEVNYDQELTADVFLFYHTGDNANLLDDYRYLFTDELTDKHINFNELGILKQENIATITLPETVDKYTLTVFGYVSEEAYREGYFRLLYSYGSNATDWGLTLNYPLIDEYTDVEYYLNLDLADGRRIYFENKGIAQIEIPDLTIQQMDGIVNIDGTFDHSLLSLNSVHPDPNSTAIFRRDYQGTYRDSIEVPFGKLEIPTEIITFLTDRGFNISKKDGAGELSLTLSQYENKMEYPDGVFYNVLANEIGDMTRVIFQLDN